MGDDAAGMENIGVDTQFFASAILPQPDASGEPIKFRRAEAMPVQDVDDIPKTRLRTTNVSVQLVSDVAHDSAGPLTDARVSGVFWSQGPGRAGGTTVWSALIELGWTIFAWPSIALQWVLNQLYGLTQNYGIAIILLTVLVRSCMVPISLKQATNAAMMQELAPEVQKIKDKYPDDAMKQHAAVQELYKKHNFNMFGGCLPGVLAAADFHRPVSLSDRRYRPARCAADSGHRLGVEPGRAGQAVLLGRLDAGRSSATKRTAGSGRTSTCCR